MFTLGIPASQYRRTTQVLNHDGSSPINFESMKQDDGFYHFSFPGVDEFDFNKIVSLLKRNGITTIGADEQLTEKKIMKLANLIKINESLQVTTNDGKVALISDPEDIKTFQKGGTVFGDDNDGKSIELSKKTSLDFQFINQEGTCGYSVNGKPANKPAGPHLIRKAIREHIKKLMNNG